jgi:hypothetical protein
MRVLVAVAVLALCSASAAGAALFLRFFPTNAMPGERVEAISPTRWYEKDGRLMAPGKLPGVVVFLIPMRLAGGLPQPGSRPPKSRSIVRLGPMLIDRHGQGYISFLVPRVAPGLYTTGFWCRTCLPGGDFFTSAASSDGWTANAGPVLRIVR